MLRAYQIGGRGFLFTETPQVDDHVYIETSEWSDEAVVTEISDRRVTLVTVSVHNNTNNFTAPYLVWR